MEQEIKSNPSELHWCVYCEFAAINVNDFPCEVCLSQGDVVGRDRPFFELKEDDNEDRSNR